MSCPNCDLAWRMLSMTCEERLAIALARRANEEGRIKSFAIGKVAAEVGMRRETATKILAEWERKGWIERRFGGVGVKLKKWPLELAMALADGKESTP